MRFRSEWLTFFTMTMAVAGALAIPRSQAPAPAAPKRPDMTAAGVDPMPVGAVRPVKTSRTKSAPHR